LCGNFHLMSSLVCSLILVGIAPSVCAGAVNGCKSITSSRKLTAGLDCHAEIESRSNMGRRFTAGELKDHRNRWFAIVKERPEVLIRAAQTQTETGPLEALLAELNFNKLAISGRLDEGFPPLREQQFDRAIATNAIAAVPQREALQRAYVLIRLVNYQFDEMKTIDRAGGRGSAYQGVQGERNKNREHLVELLPLVIDQLECALGRKE
jgi:hypothetical protein